MSDTGKIRIKGIDIRDRVIGEGEPVLMVHGWGANIDLLQPLAQRLVRFGYQLHMFDLPGFGESGAPPKPYSVFDYADVCLAYLDHRQLSTVHYFGHSLGGRIGLILASDHADRIRKMTLSNSAGIKVEAALHRKLRLKLYQTMRRSLEEVGAQSTADHLRNLYNQRYGSADYQTASPIMRQTLVNIVNQDLLEYARRVTVPTVLVWGDADDDTPLWMGQRLEESIPDAALIAHEGAGHYAYLDFPDQTAKIMDALYRS